MSDRSPTSRIRRGAVILAGHVLSSLSVVPTVILLGWIIERTGPAPRDVLDARIAGPAVIATVLVFLATLLPAGAAIVLAEWKGIRHWAFFACAGGLTALLLLGLISLVPRPDDAAISRFFFLAFVGAGLVAGLVYWSVAGRRSGADWWRDR
ncbi:MAG: hypothetical protein AB7I79_04930 [Rhizobiaceae bacterium]